MVSRDKGLERDKQPLESTMEKQGRFTEETLASLAELGTVLERIHRRLIAEGYEISHGIISFNETRSPKRKKIPS